MGQEKNRRRLAPTFTSLTQLFHKHQSCATLPIDEDFRGFCECILTQEASRAQKTSGFA
jgi:hypothetical protein